MMYAIDVYLDDTDITYVPVAVGTPHFLPPLEPSEDHIIMRTIRLFQELYSGGSIDFPSDVPHFWIGKWGERGIGLDNAQATYISEILNDAGVPYSSINIVEA